MTKRKKQAHSSTMVFDDVFRTMAQKLPHLMLALINEAFAANYTENDITAQYRNEYMSKAGKIITDSIYQISGHLYHIECQSTKDGTMAVRMFEYDSAIAIEQAVRNGKPYEIRFPESCVLYLRDDGNRMDRMEMRVIMPNQQVCTYTAKIIRISDYTSDEIFQKKLLCMLPYYILRYEKELSAIENSVERTKELLDEYGCIVERLWDVLDAAEQSDIYADLIQLINKVSEHVLRNQSKLKQEVKRVVGGRILELPSDKIKKELKKERREGQKTGEKYGRVKTLLDLAADGFLTRKQAIERSGLSAEEFEQIEQSLQDN